MRRLGLAVALVLAMAGSAWAQTDLSIQQFLVPGTNNAGFRVHANRTLGTLDLTLAHGRIVAASGYKGILTYAHNASLSSLTAALGTPAMGSHVPITGVVLPAAALQTHYVMHSRGSIIGVTITASDSVTTGRAHARATIWNPAGVQIAGSFRDTGYANAAVIGSSQVSLRHGYKTLPRGDYSFNPGEVVGCVFETTSNIAPSSISLACSVIVEF